MVPAVWEVAGKRNSPAINANSKEERAGSNVVLEKSQLTTHAAVQASVAALSKKRAADGHGLLFL